MRPPVVTVDDAPEGLVELKVRDAHDHRIGYLQIDADAMDEELMGDLKRWQLRHAHAVLSIIRGSAEIA